MKKYFTFFIFLFLSIVTSAQSWYVANSLNGWCSTCDAMYDDGTHGDAVAGDGIFSADITIPIAGRYEWKVTNSDWTTNYPGPNCWVLTTIADQVVKFTFNTNTLADNWKPTTNILNANDTHGNIVAVGAYQGWNNAGTEIMHDDGLDGDWVAGDGIYCWHTVIAVPGSYDWKVAKFGSWDSWGLDGRNINAGNANVITNAADQDVYMYFDKNTGRISSTINTALPVELSSFAAVVNGNAVKLNWTTATEKNNYGFDIERTLVDNNSTANISFDKIGFIQGHVLSNSPKEYTYTDNTISPGKKYSYRLKQVDNDGTVTYSKIVTVETGNIVNGFLLNQNYPNPFNPTTTIQFAFQNNTKAELRIYDILGNQVAELFNNNAEAGRIYDVQFNASNLASGIYYYKLTGDNKTEIKKMMLLK